MPSRIRFSLHLLGCVLGGSLAAAGTAELTSFPWAVPTASGLTVPGLPEVTGRFHVDQFGYLPDGRKIAVISDPQIGYNAAESYTPGAELQLRRVADGAVVHRGAPTLFRKGQTDRAWQWYRANPRAYDVDKGEIKSGDADKDAVGHDRWEAIAGFHLWALTGKAEYHDSFRQQHATLRQLAEPSWSPYEAGQAEALLDYTRQPGADRALVKRIVGRLSALDQGARFHAPG